MPKPPAPSSRRPPRRRTDDPRAYPLVVRVTEGEREAIRASADRHGITLSDYLRNRCLGYTMPTPRSPMSARAFASLSGVANNLNQLTRSVHIGELQDSAELVPVITELSTVVDRLRKHLLEGEPDAWEQEAGEEELAMIDAIADMLSRSRADRPQQP